MVSPSSNDRPAVILRSLSKSPFGTRPEMGTAYKPAVSNDMISTRPPVTLCTNGNFLIRLASCSGKRLEVRSACPLRTTTRLTLCRSYTSANERRRLSATARRVTTVPMATARAATVRTERVGRRMRLRTTRVRNHMGIYCQLAGVHLDTVEEL